MTSNMLIIMSDEHQARAMECAGHPLVQTPNLDRLAARGTRFENAYTPSPICVPARACFATGQYVHQTRAWDNAMLYTRDIPGWGHALQAKGVPVESIGKLRYRSEEDPAGFDTEHLPMMVAGGVGMIMAGPDVPLDLCSTPVSLIDLSVTIAGHFGADLNGAPGARSLENIACEPTDMDRLTFSEYHAAGAVSGAFMLRKGRFKYHHNIGSAPELFDLESDPEETTDLAGEPAHSGVLAAMENELRAICDPDAVDTQAFVDQADLIQMLGGREVATKLGAPGATPPPEI